MLAELLTGVKTLELKLLFFLISKTVQLIVKQPVVYCQLLYCQTPIYTLNVFGLRPLPCSGGNPAANTELPLRCT